MQPATTLGNGSQCLHVTIDLSNVLGTLLDYFNSHREIEYSVLNPRRFKTGCHNVDELTIYMIPVQVFQVVGC